MASAGYPTSTYICTFAQEEHSLREEVCNRSRTLFARQGKPFTAVFIFERVDCSYYDFCTEKWLQHGGQLKFSLSKQVDYIICADFHALTSLLVRRPDDLSRIQIVGHVLHFDWIIAQLKVDSYVCTSFFKLDPNSERERQLTEIDRKKYVTYMQNKRWKRRFSRKKIFRGLKCCFLGFNNGGEESQVEKQLLIKRFKCRGGIQQPFCISNSTQYLVASTWTEVEEHFADIGEIKFPGLLDHFLDHIHIVSYEWISFSSYNGRLVDSYTFELQVLPHERIHLSPRIFNNALDYVLSPEDLNARISRYEKTQSLEWDSIHDDIKKKKGH